MVEVPDSKALIPDGGETSRWSAKMVATACWRIPVRCPRWREGFEA